MNNILNGAIASEFRILGFMQMKYNIDLTDLRKKYQVLQLKWHPDKSGNSEMSVQISLAYRVLLDNLSRAKLILDFYKINIPQPASQQLEKWMKYFEVAQMDSAKIHELNSERDDLLVQLSAEFLKWESGSADLSLCANLYLEAFYLDRLIVSLT